MRCEIEPLRCHFPKSMHELLKKEDKYVDVEEPEKVINNLREGSELEIYE